MRDASQMAHYSPRDVLDIGGASAKQLVIHRLEQLDKRLGNLVKRIFSIDGLGVDFLHNRVNKIRVLKQHKMAFEYFGLLCSKLLLSCSANSLYFITGDCYSLVKPGCLLLRIGNGSLLRNKTLACQGECAGNGDAGRCSYALYGLCHRSIIPFRAGRLVPAPHIVGLPAGEEDSPHPDLYIW
ncbi:hypothetical protein D3C78_723350 [compost metagenome]